MSDLTLEWAWLIKVTLLLSAMWVIWLAARKSNPRWQVWPFRVGLLGAVLLSLVSFAPPLLEWPVEVARTSPQPAEEKTIDAIETEQPSVTQPQPKRRRNVAAMSDKISEFESKPSDIAQLQRRESQQITVPEQAAAPAPVSWNWSAIAVKFWIFTVAIGLIRIAIGMVRLKQLVARSTEPSDAVSAAVAKLASALQLAAPTVCVTDEISSPSVVGLFRPVILLPPSISASNDPQTLASALSHELAHIAGSDLRWDAALRVFHLLTWPHPLVWGMHRAHRAACEHVSDLVAADLIDDRSAYADCLASIALKLRRSGSDYGLAMARQADVVSRLKTLASGLQAKALGRRGKVAALATFLIALTIGTTTIVQIQQSKAEEPKPAQDPETFVLTVLSADDNKPLVDAEVKFSFRGKKNKKKTVLTDRSGVARYPFPSGSKNAFFSMTIRHSGHVPYYATFDRQSVDLLPTSKTIQMESGELVGGIIVDAEGNPIGDAKLSIHVPTIDPAREAHVYDLLGVESGPDGRWKLDAAPRPVSQLYLRVKHDKFKDKNFEVKSGLDQEYALESGVTIKGTVRSADQTPVANAKIVSGHDGSSPSAKTNAEGEFEMAGLSSGSMLLTIIADGYAPELKEVELKDGDPARVDWVLQPGLTTRFKFEDPSGKPIKGAGIAADTWRGYRSINWRSRTNADGFVEWTGAPEDTVIYDSFAQGFRSKRDMPFLPSEEPHTVVLEPEFTVTGGVTDAKTGKPVAELAAEFGWSGRDGAIYWSTMYRAISRNGKFSITYSETKSKVFVRVTAEGYQPWVSKELDLSKPAPEMSIELEPGAGPSAVVLTPAGKPARDADVILGLEGNTFQFTRGYKPHGPPQKTKTDGDGRFQLQIVEAGVAGVIAVVHDSGYAEVSLTEVDSGKPIQLQAWAKLEIRVVEGGQPVADREVQISPQTGSFATSRYFFVLDRCKNG